MRLEKLVAAVILIFLLIGCLSNFWTIPASVSKPLGVLVSFTSICALIMLYQYGTLKNAGRQRGLVFAGIIISMAGIALKILHYPGGDEALMTGSIWSAIFYTIHFTRKSSKDLLDWGKVVWMVFGPITTALILFSQGLEWWEGVFDAIFILILFSHFAFSQIFSTSKPKSVEP